MSKLYPQWGSGKKPFKKVFKAATLKKIGQQHMSAGDKIIMPEKSFKEIKRLRLGFPFMFEIRRGSCAHDWDFNTKAMRKANKPRQFCSALEFSGKEKDTIYLPVWMMRNLKVKSGGSVTLKSVFNVPSGESATFKPEKEEFFDLIAQLGPQEFLESKMKHYSILSKGERILITHEKKKYYIDIVDTQPKSAISILGDVDLNIEFAGGEDMIATGFESKHVEEIEGNGEQVEYERASGEGGHVEEELGEEDCGEDLDEFEQQVEPEIVEETIDQEDADTRRARMRAAALKRYEKLLSQTEV